MRLKKLFRSFRDCKPEREKYCIEPKITFEVDTYSYIFSFLPTIVFVPWTYRYTGSAPLSITWLNMSICFGIWRRKDGVFSDSPGRYVK